MDTIPYNQRLRADVVIELTKLPGAGGVLKRMGINNTRFYTRLRENLATHASLADAPRSGRPPKYTDELLAKAMDCLLEMMDPIWSSQEIVDTMVDAGILEAGTSVRSFMAVFQEYLLERGIRLLYGRQRLVFALSRHHANGRLAWCQEAQFTFTDTTVQHFWFVDEISLIHGGDPKGE
jgi:hypothetical protein